MFLNKFGAFVVPFLTLYLTSRGYSMTDAGLAVGAYGAGHLVASLWGGHLADKFGRRKTIVLSMFAGAAAMLWLSQARSLTAIVSLTALAGLTGELYRPASSALLTDLVQSNQRITAFAALRMAFNAGFAFGPALAGLLAGYGYFWLFAGDAATSVLFGLVALVALPRGSRGHETHVDWGEVMRVVRKDKQFQRLLLSNFPIALIFFQMTSTFGLHVLHLGFSPTTYGAVYSLNGAMVVFCELPLTALTRRLPARRVMAAGYLLVGAGFSLIAFAHSVAALMGCMMIFTLGEMLTLPVSSAYIANLAPPNMRGRYMGISGFTWAVALIISPMLGMKLYEFNPAMLWLTCGALGVLSTAIILAPFQPAPPSPIENLPVIAQGDV